MANATYGVNIIPKNNTVTLGNNNSPWHAPTPAAGTNNGELANAEFVNSEICNDAASMAIVINGNTAPKAIEQGKYLFIKNHSTLATGGYHATAAIAKNASITSNNVTPDADGIANSLNSKLIYSDEIINIPSINIGDFAGVDVPSKQGYIPIGVTSLELSMASTIFEIKYYYDVYKIRIYAPKYVFASGNYLLRIYYYKIS